MGENSHDDPPGLRALVARLAHTGAGVLRNRGELLTVEWQQEKARLMELLIWTVVLLFLAIMGMILMTATIILLFPEDKRIYVAGGFTILYLAGAVGALFGLRSLLRREPFQESLQQARKDVEWLQSYR
jgi:uncharacterized membrane protein YqjE